MKITVLDIVVSLWKLVFIFRPVLNGRRIIYIAYFFEKISKINHQSSGCSFKNLFFVGEKRNSLHSEYIFDCATCRKKEVVESEDSNIILYH